MNNPTKSGTYKATIRMPEFNTECECFAYFDPYFGWSTASKPTSWRPVRMELTISKHIEFIKY